MSWHRSGTLIGPWLLLCAACGESAVPPGDAGAAGGADAAPCPDCEREEDEEADFTGCPDSDPPFALGMKTTSASGDLTATLLQAAPAPPQRYLNDWTIALSDATGAASDLEIRGARAFMPLHNHGAAAQRIRALGAGRFSLEGLNLFMRGSWEIQLWLSSAPAETYDVAFQICISE